MEVKWGEGFFLGTRRRTREMIVGNTDGIHKASTIKRVGGHRRWGGDGFKLVRGWPWLWKPESAGDVIDAKVKFLGDDELVGKAKAQEPDDRKIYRLRLTKEEFVRHGFTEGCRGCMAMIRGGLARTHTEACRSRMEKAVEETPEGMKRKRKQEEERTSGWRRSI